VSWVVLVGMGGVVGAVARHLVAATVVDGWRDILTVNVAGSLVLGAVVAAPAGQRALLAVGVGFCGAFTTFSTFALETVAIAERGAPGRAAGFAVANLVGALAAIAVGAWTGGALAALL